MAHSVHPQANTPARYRITVRDDVHAWTFAFVPADAGHVLRRLDELVTDPDAPLNAGTAESVRREVLRTIAGSSRTDSPTEGT